MSRLLNLRELKRQCDLAGVKKTRRSLAEALKSGKLSTRDFDIPELAEAFMGREWVDNLNPRRGSESNLREAAGDAVAYSQFANITGQIAYTEILAAYDLPEFVFSKVIPTVPTVYLDKEKIPGVSEIGDEFTTVEENDEYPNVGPSEDWIEIGPKKKRGAIVPVTKECVRGVSKVPLLERCRRLGKWLGLNREKRLIDAVIDENAGATSIDNGGHRYHWKGTSYATYQASSPWGNIKTSNPLTDWTSFDAAWQTLVSLVDPYTGEPIGVTPTHLIVTPQNYHKALHALSLTQVRTETNNSAGTANRTNISDNPVGAMVRTYGVLTSALLAARAATDTDWWLAAPAEAWAYYSVWDIETQELGTDSAESFRRDVVFQFKASEMGTAATKQPRATLENQA